MTEHCCGPTFWLYLLIIAGLVLFAGMMSGLTLGLMSLSLVDLEVLIKSGTAKDQKYAGCFTHYPFIFLHDFSSPLYETKLVRKDLFYLCTGTLLLVLL